MNRPADRQDGGPAREVLLSATRLANLRSPDPGPEELLIAAEEGESESEDRDVEGVEDALAEMRTIVAEFLPPEEAYLLEAYYVLGQSHDAIATRLGRVKQSVQYRVQRALERARWVHGLKTWRHKGPRIRRDLRDIAEPRASFAVVLWANHWNQSRTAQWLGTTQAVARIETIRLHTQLAARIGDPRVEPYFADLTKIIEERAWNMGVAQKQGRRAITFPRLRRQRAARHA